MKKIVLALLFTLLLFAVFMVARMPAQFALQYMPPQSPVALQGVSGTVWHGKAQNIVYQGSSLGALEWKVHPLSLLLAKLNTDFTLKGDGITAVGNASVNKEQDIDLENLRILADAEAIPLPPSAQLVTPAGKVNANFDAIEVRGGKVMSAEGTVKWKPARITAPAEYDLGELNLKVSGKDGRLKGILSSKNSPLNTNGSLNLEPNGMLKTNIKLSPHAGTPPELRDMLPMAGRQAADGSVTIRQQLHVY